MKSKMIPVIMLIVIFVTVASFTIHQQPKPWPVPDKNNKMPNPVKEMAQKPEGSKPIRAISLRHLCKAKQMVHGFIR